MNIYETISNSESLVDGTILVLDIADSTKMKEETEEVGWLTNYAKAFDIILERLPETGTIVKYLGDGVMIFFDEDCHTDAINAAISMQEALDQAKDEHLIKVVFSAGLASGKLWRVPLGDGNFDYLGQVVDRAFRLCSAAMPKAIFVDADSIAAANVNRIRSTVGVALKRKGTDYIGSVAKIPLKGFAKLVEFYSLNWTGEQFGVKTSHPGSVYNDKAVKTVDERPVSGGHDPAPKFAVSCFGRFTEWRGNTGRVRRDTGQEYFCHKGNMVSGFDVKPGDEVFFLPVPTDKELEMSESMLPLGCKLEAEVFDVRGQKNVFLKSEVMDRLGHENVYLFWEGEPLKVGDKGTFQLGKGFAKQKNRMTPRADDFVKF